MKKTLILLCTFFTGMMFAANPGKEIKGIYYGPENGTEYQKEMCQLDLYLPGPEYKNFPVMIFIHGGGLTGGRRNGPKSITEKGIGLVSIDYRLSPKVKCPTYLEDAAEAVAWTFKNITKYGGNPNQIFVSGMSAGGYLCAMIGMDKSWTEKYGVNIDKIAGLIPQSGHMITHFTVRKERGLPAKCGLSDEFSPMYHIRKTPFPIFIQCGDNDYPSRQEENQLFVSMMKRYGGQSSNRIFYREYPGTHSTFRSEETTADMVQFILQTIGKAKKSSFFSHRYVPADKPEVIGRSYGDNLYLCPLKKGKELSIVKDNEAPVKLTGTSEEPQVISYSANAKVASVYPKSIPVDIVKNSGEYVIPHDKNAAKELTMQGGSKVKTWISDDQLHINLTAKDDHVVPAPLSHIWKSAAIEIFIDFTPLKKLNVNSLPNKQLDFKQYILAVVPSESGSKQITNHNSKHFDSKVTYETIKTADGYTLTANIPLDELPELKEDGKVIGMSVQRDYCDEYGEVSIEFLGPRGLSHRTRLHYPLFKVVK